MCLLLASTFAPPAGWADDTLLIEVDHHRFVRTQTPASLFGFNIDWAGFEAGYLSNGKPRKEIVEWLSAFPGALYRYPGGSQANYFQWDAAIGPLNERRPQQPEFGQPRVTNFGLDEYLSFVCAVRGTPLVVLNLYGERKGPQQEAEVRRLNERLARALSRSEKDLSRNGCAPKLFELGNELDWPPVRWSHWQYIDKATAFARSFRSIYPSARFIAMSRTAPTSDWGDIGTRDFNRRIAAALSSYVEGMAAHIYYDGVPVTETQRIVRHLAADIDQASDGRLRSVYVTEHARWPAKPLVGKWEDNWSTTSDLGGTLSSADFTLAMVEVPEVEAAAWLGLSAVGPWQLFSIDKANDLAYPNAIYWGLRTLRAGLLDRVHFSRSSVSAARQRLRAVVMSDAAGKRYSLLCVNRGDPQRIRLSMPQFAGRHLDAVQYLVTGDHKTLRNAPGAIDAVTMRQASLTIRFDKSGKAQYPIPRNSVVALVLENTAQ